METDILPKSALVCAAEGGRPSVGADGLVTFAFEGNANGAVNLERFHEKCLSAAGRLAVRAPNIAYGRARPEDLQVVAEMDLLRFVIPRVLDGETLEAWSGESMDAFLPPADIETPTSREDITGPLCKLPMRSLVHGEAGIHAWLLMDGTILTIAPDAGGKLTAWRRGDPGLDTVLSDAGLEMSRWMTLAS